MGLPMKVVSVNVGLPREVEWKGQRLYLDPLSERPELAWTDKLMTSVDDVTVLCTSCHRMIHRRRPAQSLAELQVRLKAVLP